MSNLVPPTGFDVEATLFTLGVLLTEIGPLPHALECAMEHMQLHQAGHFGPSPVQCSKSPCKLAGIAFAYMELHEWQVWTTDPGRVSKVEREQQCMKFLAKLDQDELVGELKRQAEPASKILGSLERLKDNVSAYVDRLLVHRNVSEMANRGQGRPKEILLQATCQHLFAGGWSYTDVAKLVGCSVERARNVIRNEDVRLYQADCGMRLLPTPKGASASPGGNET